MEGFPTREAAERAANERGVQRNDNRPRYVCKDNNGRWHITVHPEYFKDAYRVEAANKSAG
jgi:hypothetical protein